MVGCGVVLVAALCLCTPFARAEEEKGVCKTDDGKEIKVNEQYDKPGACYGNICKENGEFAVVECGISAAPAGWVPSNADISKGFPKCCPKPMPPLEIVPDILDELLPTYDPWEISYGDNATVDMGNELTPTQVKGQPSVKYAFADPKAFYLLAMVNPDAPSLQNPEHRELLHWLVVNIPGDEVASGEVLAEYIGSGPPVETGLHRYVFLLYKQPEKLTFDEAKINKNSRKGREKFSVKKFAEKYKLGHPVAMNVYQAQYDDYVPELHKQLGSDDMF